MIVSQLASIEMSFDGMTDQVTNSEALTIIDMGKV